MGRNPGSVVELKEGVSASEAKLIDHVRTLIAHYKAPKETWFRDRPRTSTVELRGDAPRSLVTQRVDADAEKVKRWFDYEDF